MMGSSRKLLVLLAGTREETLNFTVLVGQIRRLRRTEKEGLYAYDQCHVAVEGLSLD